jgi:RNA polymerase sigma-70 factor (ECF subfamily)
LTEFSPNTDTTLLTALANDDEQAFATLYHRYHQKLFYFVLNFTQSQQTAEDVLQEIFVKIWSERKQLAGITNFNAWIFRVTKNHVLNSLKRMARETLILAEIARDMNAANPGTEDTYAILGYKDVHAVLKTGMNELPPQQKLVMELSRDEGLKYEEIGERLNISPLTVKKHAAQALQYLREKIRRHYALPAPLFSAFILLQNFF